MSAHAAGAHDEEGLIAAILDAVPHLPSPLGPGDDCALLPAGSSRVLTTDALVEGTHFLRAHPADALGWKSLAVNLSDVAAMGALPEAFALSIALPRALVAAGAGWVEAFAAGLGACARWGGVVIAGGDTVRSPGLVALTITAWGTLDGPPLTRVGGRAGDVLMVAGDLGRSGLGLERWLALAAGGAVPDPRALHAALAADPALRAQLRPEPPLWAGPFARAHGARAGMDLSDGLATDLPRLARASGVAIAVDLDRLPPDPVTDAGGLDARARASHGEDYGLAVLVPPERAAAFEARGFAPIGFARAGPPDVVWRDGGREVAPVTPAFSHFRPGGGAAPAEELPA